jgi:hypothetical protein
MNKKNVLLGTVFTVGLICGGALMAQMPAENIDPHKHPNLAEAQHHIQQAWAKVDEAQQANKEQLGGHGSKAKEHLEAADRELKEAAEFANHH